MIKLNEDLQVGKEAIDRHGGHPVGIPNVSGRPFKGSRNVNTGVIEVSCHSSLASIQDLEHASVRCLGKSPRYDPPKLALSEH